MFDCFNAHILAHFITTKSLLLLTKMNQLLFHALLFVQTLNNVINYCLPYTLEFGQTDIKFNYIGTFLSYTNGLFL